MQDSSVQDSQMLLPASSPITSLPSSLLLSICHYLDAPTIFHFYPVCRLFYSASATCRITSAYLDAFSQAQVSLAEGPMKEVLNLWASFFCNGFAHGLILRLPPNTAPLVASLRHTGLANRLLPLLFRSFAQSSCATEVGYFGFLEEELKLRSTTADRFHTLTASGIRKKLIDTASWGGAYLRASDMELAGRGADAFVAQVGPNGEEVSGFASRENWSSMFRGIAWDVTLVAVNWMRGEWFVMWGTDTD
eukprot:TRINITY_DN521_c0_g1_i9.p1 TRINITY_DN521_c0_g1~~TRINITY_DN521_c0_g1_i9.p1  ORF type:complete len:249 (-),score=11.03 TRINITY_DN521_c0_g1_i9:43-789(-)